MYTIEYINFGYGPDRIFETETEAKRYGIEKGFEFVIYYNRVHVAGVWHPLNGYCSFQEEQTEGC